MCGPRADSGEKPSKASQAVANLGKFFSLGRDSEAMRLRFLTSLGPETVSFFGRKREKIMSCVGVSGRREKRTGPFDAHV